MAASHARDASPWDTSVVAQVVGRVLAELQHVDPELLVALALARLGVTDIPLAGPPLQRFVDDLTTTVLEQEGQVAAAHVRNELLRNLEPALTLAPGSASRISGIRAKQADRAESDHGAGPDPVASSAKSSDPQARPTLPVAEPLAPFHRATVPAPRRDPEED